MATTIAVIFCLIFTTTYAYNPTTCGKIQNCQCSTNITGEIKFINISDKDVDFGIKVKSWVDLQLDCNNLDWDEFDIKRINFEDLIDLVEFKNCKLPREFTLKQIVQMFGIKETNGVSFQSYNDLSNALKKEHLQGFPNVSKLILSHNGLNEISPDWFNSFPYLESLDLSENPLVLYKDIFNETLNLKELDLSGIEIKQLPAYLFTKLKRIEILNLERMSMEVFHDPTFERLKTLKYLNLGSNLLTNLQDYLFFGLMKLETIDLSNNTFNEFSPELFSQNKKLKKVLLNNNKGELTTLPDKLFMQLTNLEEVQLRNNGLKSLPVNLFRGSTSLKYIDLSENFLQEIPELIFRDLQNVKKLSIRYNMIERLPDLIFRYVTNVTNLDLSFNRIDYVQRYLFNGLKLLKELNMEGNGLKYINNDAFKTNIELSIAKFSNNQLQFNYAHSKSSPFCENFHLTELHLANNQIKDFLWDFNLGQRTLQLLNLSHNDISKISAVNLIFASDDIVVDLRYNKIRHILLNEIDKYSYHNKKESNIIVYVENNPVLCDCDLYDLVRYVNKDMPYTAYNFVKLRLGNLRCLQPNGTEGPQIDQLNFKTYKCLETQYFKLPDNCQYKCTCHVRPRDLRRVLDCSHKNLFVFKPDMDKIYLVGIHTLIVDLRWNNLRKIDSFKPLEMAAIERLYLSNNKIFQLSADTLPEKLNVLELHNNKLSRLDKSVIDFFKRQNFRRFTLSGNPFKCDCNTTYLLNFIEEQQHIHKDLKNLKCKKKMFL
ncbi:PREDICTED: protein toll-like [Polistes dominula]|uniref:Protein toll-like n=1 Tax=Polistes dominula TaxID=743375 RepID=A0ABM1JA71_POLDO|nr:PREDICTED: protein toll-like [Polistes dominula]